MYMRRIVIAGIGLVAGISLCGCVAGSTGQSSSTPTPTANATVNLVVTDTPPTEITVLSFQVQITSAVLQPGNVSLLPRPVTVDLAQLVTDTGFLASTVIDSGTYTSMTMTLANPQVTIENNRPSAITVAGQTCAAGAICTIVPALNNASVTISSGVFPVTVAANSTTGLNLDLSIPDLLQSDLSVTLANGTSINLSVLPQPSSSSSEQAKIDDVFGTISSISGSQIGITTAFGDSLVLTSSGSTTYNYPASVCSTAGASCLAVGQVVTTDLSLLGNGALSLNAISYAGNSGAPEVKGLVLSTDTAAAVPTVQLLVQRSINVSSLPPGQIATVSLPSGTKYAVGTAVYPGTSGASYSSALDLLTGQELVVNVGSNLVTGSAPSFTASTAYLESSQLIGVVASVNAANSSLTINGLSGLLTGARPIVQQMGVQTAATTEFIGFSPASFSAVSAGQFVAAKGPLFNTVGSSGYPTISAIQLRKRAAGN
jgi:hypothetical protein